MAAARSEASLGRSLAVRVLPGEFGRWNRAALPHLHTTPEALSDENNYCSTRPPNVRKNLPIRKMALKVISVHTNAKAWSDAVLFYWGDKQAALARLAMGGTVYGAFLSQESPWIEFGSLHLGVECHNTFARVTCVEACAWCQ